MNALPVRPVISQGDLRFTWRIHIICYFTLHTLHRNRSLRYSERGSGFILSHLPNDSTHDITKGQAGPGHAAVHPPVRDEVAPAAAGPRVCSGHPVNQKTAYREPVAADGEGDPGSGSKWLNSLSQGEAALWVTSRMRPLCGHDWKMRVPRMRNGRFAKGSLALAQCVPPVKNGAIFYLPAWKAVWALGPGSWLTLAMNLLLLNVKSAFSGHCAILFMACLWGAFDQ